MNKTQRADILAGIGNSRLMFSTRTAIAEEFRDYCSAASTEECTENFLAWLVTSELGHKVARAVIKEVIERQAKK